MLMERVPQLDWPQDLFREVGKEQLAADPDENGFGEAVDFAAVADTLAYRGDRGSLTRYFYNATARLRPTLHLRLVTPVPFDPATCFVAPEQGDLVAG
jgi:hypothetical protein